MHEGMTWGAVALKRTTAIGLDEQTLSNQSTSSLDLPQRVYQQRTMTTEIQNEATGFGAECLSRTGTNQQEKTGRNHLTPQPLSGMTDLRR